MTPTKKSSKRAEIDESEQPQITLKQLVESTPSHKKCESKQTEIILVSGEKITVDAGIANLVKELNNQGFETIQSCSGLKEDHTCPCSFYIGFKIPTESLSRAMFTYPYDVETYVQDYANCLQEAISTAGFIADFGRTWFIPSVTAKINPQVPFLLQEEKDDPKAYTKRANRLKENDTCYNREITDEELKYRFKLLLERLKANHCKFFKDRIEKKRIKK